VIRSDGVNCCTTVESAGGKNIRNGGRPIELVTDHKWEAEKVCPEQ
jgi:hypothetical protein